MSRHSEPSSCRELKLFECNAINFLHMRSSSTVHGFFKFKFNPLTFSVKTIITWWNWLSTFGQRWQISASQNSQSRSLSRGQSVPAEFILAKDTSFWLLKRQPVKPRTCNVKWWSNADNTNNCRFWVESWETVLASRWMQCGLSATVQQCEESGASGCAGDENSCSMPAQVTLATCIPAGVCGLHQSRKPSVISHATIKGVCWTHGQQSTSHLPAC